MLGIPTVTFAKSRRAIPDTLNKLQIPAPNYREHHQWNSVPPQQIILPTAIWVQAFGIMDTITKDKIQAVQSDHFNAGRIQILIQVCI